jgi:hypothetical protein
MIIQVGPGVAMSCLSVLMAAVIRRVSKAGSKERRLSLQLNSAM